MSILHFIKENRVLDGQNWINMNFPKHRLWAGDRGFLFHSHCFVKNDWFSIIQKSNLNSIPTKKKCDS